MAETSPLRVATGLECADLLAFGLRKEKRRHAAPLQISMRSLFSVSGDDVTVFRVDRAADVCRP